MANAEDDRGAQLRRLAPASRAGVVTPNDDEDNVPRHATLYIAGGGDLTVIPEGQDEPVAFEVADFSYFNVVVKRVLASGTSATGIRWLS